VHRALDASVAFGVTSTAGGGSPIGAFTTDFETVTVDVV
jgi:hypothetical protein